MELDFFRNNYKNPTIIKLNENEFRLSGQLEVNVRSQKSITVDKETYYRDEHNKELIDFDKAWIDDRPRWLDLTLEDTGSLCKFNSFTFWDYSPNHLNLEAATYISTNYYKSKNYYILVFQLLSELHFLPFELYVGKVYNQDHVKILTSYGFNNHLYVLTNNKNPN